MVIYSLGLKSETNMTLQPGLCIFFFFFFLGGGGGAYVSSKRNNHLVL